MLMFRFKEIMMRRTTVVGVLALVAALPLAGATLLFSPDAQSVEQGDQAVVSVRVSGLDNDDAVGAFDLTVNFNSTILSLVSVTYSNALGDPASPLQTVLTTPGTSSVNLLLLSGEEPATLLGLQGATVTLATLRFATPGIGVSALTFSDSPLVISDEEGNVLPVSLNTGSITVAREGDDPVVPEPSTGLLLLGPLAVLAWRARRSR